MSGTPELFFPTKGSKGMARAAPTKAKRTINFILPICATKSQYGCKKIAN